MKIFIALSACASLFLFSCQKEVDFANGNNNGNGGSGGGNTSSLLTKIVSVSGTDSSSLLFGYNSSKKLVTLNFITVSGGTTSLTEERVERNAQGIIQKLILKDDQYQQLGFDSVETIVGYSSGVYTYKLTTIDLVALVYKDSVSLIPDGTGKIVSERIYDDAGAGIYDETGKIEYTYSGNNIASIKYYSYDATTSSYSLEQTYTYDEYDNKVSPMSVANEAFVFDSPELYSANNPTKSSIGVTGSPAAVYTTTYTYNASNKPLSASSTIQPGNSTVTGTYYYQ